VEVKLILAAAVIGLILDSALASAGLVSFTSGVWIDGIAPHWMVGLWIAFATTLNISMRWLVTRPALAVVFGALGGPVAYCAGAKLGAIAINPSATTFIAIGLGWAAAMWLLTLAVAHINNPSTAMERAI
jgi:hypothetical protein